MSLRENSKEEETKDETSVLLDGFLLYSKVQLEEDGIQKNDMYVDLDDEKLRKFDKRLTLRVK